MNTDYGQLERLLEVGRVDDARELVGGLLAEAPNDPDLHWYAARAALLNGDVDEGRRQIEAALGSDPGHFGARFLLFRIEMHTGRGAEAEQLVTDLIREQPEDADLLTEYADLMIQTLHLDKARALTDEALRLEPDNRSARITDVLLSTIEGQRSRAGTQLTRLVRENPDARDVAYTLLQNLTENGRSREALVLCQEMMQSDPGNQNLVDLAIALRVQTHPLALPLWPMQKFGWRASAAIWLGAALSIGLLRQTNSMWAVSLVSVYVVWVVYTWVFEAIMTRWFRARGI